MKLTLFRAGPPTVATDNEPGKIRAFTSAGDVKNSSTTKKVPTDRKQTQISRRGHCDVGSDKICSDTCVVVATDPVLKKIQLSNPVNRVLEIKKTEKRSIGCDVC